MGDHKSGCATFGILCDDGSCSIQELISPDMYSPGEPSCCKEYCPLEHARSSMPTLQNYLDWPDIIQQECPFFGVTEGSHEDTCGLIEEIGAGDVQCQKRSCPMRLMAKWNEFVGVKNE